MPLLAMQAGRHQPHSHGNTSSRIIFSVRTAQVVVEPQFLFLCVNDAVSCQQMFGHCSNAFAAEHAALALTHGYVCVYVYIHGKQDSIVGT